VQKNCQVKLKKKMSDSKGKIISFKEIYENLISTKKDELSSFEFNPGDLIVYQHDIARHDNRVDRTTISDFVISKFNISLDKINKKNRVSRLSGQNVYFPKLYWRLYKKYIASHSFYRINRVKISSSELEFESKIKNFEISFLIFTSIRTDHSLTKSDSSSNKIQINEYFSKINTILVSAVCDLCDNIKQQLEDYVIFKAV